MRNDAAEKPRQITAVWRKSGTVLRLENLFRFERWLWPEIFAVKPAYSAKPQNDMRHFMKTFIQTIFLFLIPLNIFAQNENINSGKYHPAKEIFEKKYKKTDYPKFTKAQIKLESNKVVLNNTKTIEYFEKLDSKYRIILENGLLDPYEINKSFYVKLTAFDELKLLNPNSQTKRFKFWIFPTKVNSEQTDFEKLLSSRINPDEYYFELTNENANENTSYEDFISGAKLTFLTFGTIII